MTINKTINALGALYLSILATLFITFLTGCGSATGWQFQIGVAPIKAVDNRQQLTQEGQPRPQSAINKGGY